MHPCPARLKSILLAVLLPATALCLAAETNPLHQATAQGTNDGAGTPPRPANWAVKLERPGLPNCYQVTTHLYRGAQPSARGMAELKAMGVKTVVNLRSLHSDADDLAGTGLKQGRLHMKPWHAEDEDIICFLKLATNTNNLPVFVHCQRGADRTGMACAMYRIAVCGWTKEAAIQEMKEGGFGFNPAWKNIVRYIEQADIAKIKRQAGLASHTAAVEALKRGSVEGRKE
jgi:protein tyrosine/serine phosphatase